MKKRISFSTWISVLFGGIRQFVCDIFSCKNKTPFWRVVWSAITICIIAITLMFGYVFYDELNRDRYYHALKERTLLGDSYYFHDKGRGKGKSDISEIQSGKKILTGLDWIARPDDGDSLIVFAKDGKRGFFNRYSGKIAIPAKYDAAWCFNDGVAGVCVGDSVFFIDHNDSPINSRKFVREPNRSYAYHGNYIIFTDNGKSGLIDRGGDIAVPAVYDGIMPMANRMWKVSLGDMYGAINAEGQQILPCEYKAVYIYEEGGIVVSLTDNTKKRLDYDGAVIDDFVYDYINRPQYYTDKFDDNGERLPAVANHYVYSVNEHQGLMDMDGRPITPPLYSAIGALGPDLYDCTIAKTNESIIINGNGKKMGN